MFSALVLRQEQNQTLAGIDKIDESQCHMVMYDDVITHLNYKDGLAITGKVKSSATSLWCLA